MYETEGNGNFVQLLTTSSTYPPEGTDTIIVVYKTKNCLFQET